MIKRKALWRNDGFGVLGGFQNVNTHVVENKVKDIVSKFEVNISDGITKGTGNAQRSEIDEVIKNDYDINGNLIN